MTNLQPTLEELKKRRAVHKNAGLLNKQKALNDLLYVVDVLIEKASPELTTGANGLNLIKSFEGCHLNAYLCPANVPTIGYGHTKNVRLGMKITPEQAEKFLRDDLKTFEKIVKDNVKMPLNQNQFDALVSFVFNVGGGNFKTSTLLKVLNKGDYGAAAGEFSKWVYGGGKKLPGLVRRRQAEAELFSK